MKRGRKSNPAISTENLNLLIRGSALSYQAISQCLDISTDAMHKHLIGTALPDLATIIKYADFFAVSVDYILGREVPPIDASRFIVVDAVSMEKKLDTIGEAMETLEKAIRSLERIDL